MSDPLDIRMDAEKYVAPLCPACGRGEHEKHSATFSEWDWGGDIFETTCECPEKACWGDLASW